MEQLNNLVSAGVVEAYPPLVDKKGSYTAQFEHVSSPLLSIETMILMNVDYRPPTKCEGGYQPWRRLLDAHTNLVALHS